MKKFIVIMSVLGGVFFASQSKAQINISINIGSQPAWGPSGYNHVDYYYLPDINAYYDVATAQYIYIINNRWHFGKKLPKHYRNYNIYNSYKVVVNRQNPYQNNQYDIQHYSQYKGRSGQAMLRDNRGYMAMHNNGHYSNNSNNYGNKNNSNNNNNYNKNKVVEQSRQTITKRDDRKGVREVNRTTKKAITRTADGRGR